MMYRPLVLIGFVAAVQAAVPKIEQVICDRTINGQQRYLIGLRPWDWGAGSVEGQNRCELFAYCRQGTPGTKPLGSRVSCKDWDPEKPFFDAKSCSCVASKDHCDDQNHYMTYYDNCIREYPKGGVEPVENCRHWGQNGTFTEGLFPVFDDATSYWHCSPAEDATTKAVKQPCPDDGHDYVFNMEEDKCYCDSRGADGGAAIIAKSRHPMNRYNCLQKGGVEIRRIAKSKKIKRVL